MSFILIGNGFTLWLPCLPLIPSILYKTKEGILGGHIDNFSLAETGMVPNTSFYVLEQVPHSFPGEYPPSLKDLSTSQQ